MTASQAALESPPDEPRRDARRTRARILDAAREAFCARGVDGATMESIARAAGVNKRLVYHHFGNKEDLYLAVLEQTYVARRRHDAVLAVDECDPEEGMRRLIRAAFAYCREHPEYIKLLTVENLNGARHLRRSRTIRDLHTPLLAGLGELLERGRRIGLFRAFADPFHVYLTVASLCFFYHSNTATLSSIFGRDLASAEAAAEREAHVEEVVLAYLRPRTALEREGRPPESNVSVT